jgi:hypothetical protein
MATPDRSRDQDGTFREKRGDAKVQNLKRDYPVFEGINGNMKLGTLKKQFHTESLDGVMRALRKR